MRKLGVKLWTRDVLKNKAFFDDVAEAVRRKEFEYVELFVFPNTYEDTFEAVREGLRGCPVIIHNSHSAYGFDCGDSDALKNNLKDIGDSQRFADALHADIIIVHAGCGTLPQNIDETIRQFRLFNDMRIAVENMAAFCMVSKKFQHGVFPEQIERIKAETGCKFCMDFSHAVCAANYYKRKPVDILDDFRLLEPDMYHQCDGRLQGIDDVHLHFGEGDFDLETIINRFIDEEARVTMETGYKPPLNADPWRKDRDYFRRLEINSSTN